MTLKRTIVDPFILTAIGILSPIVTVYWIATNFNVSSIMLLLIVAWVVGINTTIFAHRAWTHKSWLPNRKLNTVGLFLFTVTMISSSIGWVSVHREHHRYSDTENDPHSPYFKSRWTIQFLPYFNRIRVQYVVDLVRDSQHVWFAKNYWIVILLWLSVLYSFSSDAMIFWFAVIGMSSMKMLSINSLGHKTPKWLLPIGSCENSTNSVILAVLNINNGEAWHRNHHEDPMNYRFGKKWYEVDPAARTIELFEQLGLAKITRG